MPFEYVQLNAYLLNMFAVLVPVAIASFTDELFFAVCATFVTVGSFYAIFIVANDMEVPQWMQWRGRVAAVSPFLFPRLLALRTRCVLFTCLYSPPSHHDLLLPAHGPSH